MTSHPILFSAPMARAMEPRLFAIFDAGFTSKNWLEQNAFLNAEKVVKRTRKKCQAALAALEAAGYEVREKVTASANSGGSAASKSVE